ncbi:unnamed protein product [Merluccius merluccius]
MRSLHQVRMIISQDFEQLHPEAAEKLFQNWATIAEKVLAYAQQEGKLAPVLDNLTPVANNGERALKILPRLLPPSIYKVGGKVFRPTAEESQSAFIYVQPVGTNMVEYINTSQLNQQGPHVLCLGDEFITNQAFIIISGHAIEATSLLEAVDVCFKAFFVFDVNYPKQCVPTWEFIQHALYNIDGHESSAVKFLRTTFFSTD